MSRQNSYGLEHWLEQRANFTANHQFKFHEDGISSWTQNEALNQFTDKQIISLYDSLVDGKSLKKRLPLSFVTHVLMRGWNAAPTEFE